MREKIETVTCDRCKIIFDEEIAVELPFVRFYRRSYNPGECPEQMDICPRCQRGLERWLRTESPVIGETT